MAEIKPMILCVDDDRDSLKLLERFLGVDYVVLAAESGQAGLEIAQEMNPDLVLLDVKMPEMDGYQTCSLLRDNEQTAYIPVIFVTALGDEQDKARAFAVGAADYLVKPIIRNLLLDKVLKHLQTKSLWRNLRQDIRSWHDLSQPAVFIQFKEFLFNKFSIDNKVRYTLSSRNPANIYSLAVEIGILEDVLAKHVADFLNLPYTAKVNPDEIRLGVLPAAFSKHNHVLAVKSSAKENAFIISNPFDWNLVDILGKLSNSDRRLNITITEPANIDLVFGDMPEAVDIRTRSETSKPSRAAVSLAEEISEQPVEHITNAILNKAVVERASDIHIEPKEDDTKVRFRIDGDLRNALTLKKNTGVMVISRFKVLGGLDISEKRKPQDGGFVTTLKDRTFNLRLSTTSTPNGESLVMRLLEPYTEPKKLNELGMSDQQTAAMVHLVTKSAGIILIVGSTGSGKTTTIYSLLHSVDFQRRSVLSVEDPVEYRMPFVNQQQVNNKAGVTFEALLKTAVRQDPDILFLGEVRDDFSAKIALDFSSTGHLTITTMHTSNATTALFRLERLGIDRGTMADTILAIVAQKLVKKLCPHCKEIMPLSPEEKALFAAYTDEIPSLVAHPVGCNQCGHTGYLGREGVYEILEFSPEIVEMVRAKDPISKIRAFVRNRGDFLVSTHAITKAKNLIFSPKDIFEMVLIEEISGMEKSPAATKDQETIPNNEPAKKQASILVVEDDEDTRKLIVRFLEKDGYGVTTAADGVDALLCLGKNDFDLILSDVNMPNLDGFKLLEMVNQKGVRAPVIFLTSRSDSSDEERGLKLGAMDYIKKPIKKDWFLLRVKKILADRR